MKITSTNNFAAAFSSFSVTSDDDTNQDIEDITTGDFSTRYSSNGSSINFTISKTFSAAFDCEYVAIAGHTFGNPSGGGSVEIRVNSVLKDTIVYSALSRNDVLMSHFDSVSCTTIEIKFIKNVSTDKITISYVSAGEIIALGSNNNEEGGFQRAWLTDSKKVRSTINDTASPVAYIRQSVTRKITLNIKNINISITNSSSWLDLLDRIYDGGDFFIKEEDGDTTGISDNPKSSTMCFNAEMVPPKAHSATRQLNNVSIKYNAFIGH